MELCWVKPAKFLDLPVFYVQDVHNKKDDSLER